jgi:chemotaxis protein histidine kinase CheA
MDAESVSDEHEQLEKYVTTSLGISQETSSAMAITGSASPAPLNDSVSRARSPSPIAVAILTSHKSKPQFSVFAEGSSSSSKAFMSSSVSLSSAVSTHEERAARLWGDSGSFLPVLKIVPMPVAAKPVVEAVVVEAPKKEKETEEEMHISINEVIERQQKIKNATFGASNKRPQPEKDKSAEVEKSSKKPKTEVADSSASEESDDENMASASSEEEEAEESPKASKQARKESGKKADKLLGKFTAGSTFRPVDYVAEMALRKQRLAEAEKALQESKSKREKDEQFREPSVAKGAIHKPRLKRSKGKSTRA